MFRLVLAVLAVAASLSAVTPSSVLVVYRNNTAGQQIAQYYQSARGIPSANLLPLTISTSFYYYNVGQYTKFRDEMITPIKNKIATLTGIDTIVLMGDVPSVFFDGASTGRSIDSALIILDSLPLTDNPTFAGQVNPYYGANVRFTRAAFPTMYLVSRIVTAAQIDGPMYAESHMSWDYGIAYVDSKYTQPGGVPYTISWLSTQPRNYSADLNADYAIAYTAKYFSDVGLMVSWDNTINNGNIEIGEAGAKYVAAPRALFYAGWYNFARYQDVYTWLPGSVGLDLNSGKYWAETAMSKGLSCALHVVGEPGLSGHQQPDAFFDRFVARGWTFAEASMASQPYTTFMGINKCDPLYKVTITPPTPAPPPACQP
jgi:uncharacterized protein (TIGR03790 family)